MAFLTPDLEYKGGGTIMFLTPDKKIDEYGLTINEKLITVSSGVRYYSNRKLNTPGHKPMYVTIHNTPKIKAAKGTTMAEQYSRATYNNNMGDVVVHYYIDGGDCWHILADDTVGWHAADGVNGPGNTKSVAIEIIGESSQAESRGALLAAILLHKYGLGIDRMKTHHDWYSEKYCPAYILPHWSSFVAKVKNNLTKIEEKAGGDAVAQPAPATKKTYYRVQVGYFGVHANAEKMKEMVKKAGFDAIIKTAADGKHWRVQVGYYGVKANAVAMKEKLNKAGFDAIIIEEG